MNHQINECQMIEEQNQIKCNQHNQIADLVEVDQNKNFKLLCKQCFQEMEGQKTVYNINEAINEIKKRKQAEYQEYYNNVNPEFNSLKDSIYEMSKLQESIQQLITNLLEALNNWKQELESKFEGISKYSFIKELQQQPQHNNIVAEFIQKTRQTYTKSIQQNLQYLKIQVTTNNNLKQIHGLLKITDECQLSPRKQNQQFQQSRQNIKIEIKHNPDLEIFLKGENSELIEVIQLNKFQMQKGSISFKQQNKIIQQSTKCLAVSFNKDDSILATACNKEIKLWKFQDGNIGDLLYSLNEHTSEINTLLFSKKKNWLFSAGKDLQIILWKPKKILFNFNITTKQTFKDAHREQILLLILNENENQLISCSTDCKICIWAVNYQKNSICFQQSLEKHNGPVIQVSLNQKNNLMVSTALDKQVIIWSINDQQEWSFKYVIENQTNDVGYRISFINDQTVVWQKHSGQIHVFREEQEKFKEIPELKILLAVQGQKDGDFQFPSIFNSQQKILIQKHLKNVYFFTIDKQDNLINQEQFISLENEENYGNLSNNGKYLVIWCKEQIRVYEIFYN